jgi:predicted DsbA family dithiol-disulfide isomerase
MQVMSMMKERQIDSPRLVLHWYDFLCPFCYIGQHRNAILRRDGFEVAELAFQAHPDIPLGGISAGPRIGPMYTMLEHEAKEAGMPLRWPSHLPNTRQALASAEWTRRYQPEEFPGLHRALFRAHFALGEDLEDQAVIDRHASAAGIDLPALHAALTDGSAAVFVSQSEQLGVSYGVRGTPAWQLNGQLISGLRSAHDFELFAKERVNAHVGCALR